MPKDFESNWDDLARQLGFEPPEEPEMAAENESEDDMKPQQDDSDQPANSDLADSEADAKESIADFFDEKSAADEASFDSSEPVNLERKTTGDPGGEVVVHPSDESMTEESSSGENATRSGDHWGSLAGTLGLENEKGTASKTDASQSDEVFSETSVHSEAASAEGGTAEEDESTGDVETIEFAVEDLTDDDDDRPRRRRKKRRRRRAAIEELREELEREKQQEASDELPEPVAEESETESPEEKEVSTGRRRRRRRDRTDSSDRGRSRDRSSSRDRKPAEEAVSDTSSEEFSGEDDDDSREKVSKNRRRRRRRERPDDSGDRGGERLSDKDESKPERKFPTWEEAIMPLIEANMERSEKPQRRRRPRRNRDS